MTEETLLKKRWYQQSGLWAAVYYGALTVFMTMPLTLRVFDSMVGEVGDNIYFVWLIGWFRKALFELHVDPFNVWFLNYPQGWSLAYTEITPANLALALPFSLIGGETFAYNMAMLLTFFLSGLFMFLWVRQLTGRTDAALIAGTLFAFLPYRFAHFRIGHLNLSGTQWFPLYFMGLFNLFEARRWEWKPVLAGGIGLGLIALTSQYYLFMTLFISAFMGIFYLLYQARDMLRSQAWWGRLIAMGAASLPLTILGVLPFFALLGEGGLPDRNVSLARLYSSSPTDFILPSTDHFLWGQWVGSHFNRDLWVEGTFYIGIVAAALAVLAWVKRKDLPSPRLMPLLLWTSVFAFILALGIDLHWNNQSVTIPAPAFLAERLGRTELPIPLPSYFLFLYFPFFAKLRAIMRFGFFVPFFISVAAGLGSDWLLQKFNGKQKLAVTALILGLVIFDFYPGAFTDFSKVQPRAVDNWLAQQEDEGAVMQLPFYQLENQEVIYGQLIHGKPFVGGFFNAFPPEQYRRIKPAMEGFPSPESVAMLREMKVRYIVVDVKEYGSLTELRASCESLGLKFAGDFEGEAVFLLNDGMENE